MSVGAWVQDRVPTEVTHLDAAACGRVSRAVLDAQTAHLHLEAVVGGYVAEAQAGPVIDGGRDALGAMVSLSGDDVCFSENGGASFQVLLEAWPLKPGARIGVAPSEYGGNARLLRLWATSRGWELVPLPVDPLGRVTDVPAGLELLSLSQVPSQRGVVQPVVDVLAAGVPVILDVAQALGQTEVPPGAAAYVGTSRKWLCGPRGVGFAAIAPSFQDQLTEPPTLNASNFEGVRRYDSAEAHLAGRVGLALAARTWSPALLPVVQAGASAARVLLEGAGGWSVVEPVDEPTGITTLTHPTADAVAKRAALLAEGFVVSVVPVHRADDVPQPLLRVSTAAWVTPGDLEALASAMDSVGFRA
jgi:pyridoxal 5-phosphate dependent beta-lyase